MNRSGSNRFENLLKEKETRHLLNHRYGPTKPILMEFVKTGTHIKFLYKLRKIKKITGL